MSEKKTEVKDDSKEEKDRWVISLQAKGMSDMPTAMLEDAIAITKDAFVKSYEVMENLIKEQQKSCSDGDRLRAKAEQDINRAVARTVKGAFDKKYEPTWHVIVGSSFGSGVVHESRRFCLLDVNGVNRVLIFKAGFPRGSENLG